MAHSQVLEGTWEEIKVHDQELAGKRFRLVPVPSDPATAAPKARNPRKSTRQDIHPAPRQLAGMGKFAGIIPSSEEFMRQKQEEIVLEERKFSK